MKANEVRIGNYYNPHGKEYFQITAEDIVCMRDDPQDDFFQPMLLTPEILLKCGWFENKYGLFKNPILKCRWITNNLCGDNLDICFLRFDSIMSPPKTSTDIYFLHELQNLYFALIGEELNYTP
jgi:hypothetical protein